MTVTAWLLAAEETFRPFWQPLPVWDYWYLLLLPLCVGVAAASYLAVERPFLRLRRRWGPTAAAEIRERA